MTKYHFNLEAYRDNIVDKECSISQDVT